MKSVGEAMGIGRTFGEAFLKARRSRELDGPDAWELPEGAHPWFRAELERLEASRRAPATTSSPTTGCG